MLLVSAIHLHQSELENGFGTESTHPAIGTDKYGLPFLGINVELEQYTAEEEQRARLQELSDLGFEWARQRVDWGDIEPEPGVFDWTVSDSMISSINEAGLEPVFVLDGSPQWARSGDGPNAENSLAPPDDYEDYARFASRLAERYADQVRFYQIWDEPNIAPHWGDSWIQPVEYAHMLKLASESIRAIDDDSVIILGALGPTWDRGHQAIDEPYYLQRLIAAGAAPYFDMVAIQPFGFGDTPEDPSQHYGVLNFQRAQIIRRELVAAGHSDIPIVAVRFGWNRKANSPWRTVSSEDQALFTGQALDIGYQQWPWVAAMGYAIDQPNVSQADPPWGLSLNGELEETIANWSGKLPDRLSTNYAPAQSYWWRWLLLVLVALLAAQRTVSALRLLPLTSWRLRLLSIPKWAHIGIWVAVLLAYYDATWPPFIIACWVAMVILFLVRPTDGILLSAALLPFYFQHKEVAFGDTLQFTVPPAIAISLCMLPALLLHQYRVKRRPDQWDWLVLSWVGIAAISAIRVWHWPAYWVGLLEIVACPLILFWAIRAFQHTRADVVRTMSAAAVGGIVFALIGLYGWADGSGVEVDSILRLSGAFYSPNHAALYLERILFVMIALGIALRGSRRVVALLGAVAISLAILLTASRGALLLGIPTGLLVFAIVILCRRNWSKVRNYSVAGVLIAVPIFLVAALLATTATRQRLTNLSSIVARLDLWRQSLHLALDYWSTGVGPNGFFWRFPAYIPVQSGLNPDILHPHNIWIEFATTGGVLAVIWLLAALYWVGRAVMVQYRRSAAKTDWLSVGLVAAFAASVAHGQVDAFGALPDLAMLNWLLLGLLVVFFDCGDGAPAE